MKTGFSSVLYLPDSLITPIDEQCLVLGYAYELAYEEYLKSSFKNKLFRFIHYSKPKKISIVAKLAYELRVLPFKNNEIFIYDSSSSLLPEKTVFLSLDPISLQKAADNIVVKASTIVDQTEFVQSLNKFYSEVQSFKTDAHKTLFLQNSKPLAIETLNYLPGLENLLSHPPIVRIGKESLNDPENLIQKFGVFLGNSNNFIASLENSKNRVTECCKQMIVAIEKRYPIIERTFKADIDFGWKIQTIDFNGENVLSPVKDLIAKMNLEVKPEIDKMEREAANQVAQLEQDSKIEGKEIERRFANEKHNLEARIALELDTLESSKNSYEKQINNLQSEYEEVSEAYERAQEQYDSIITSESVDEPIGLTSSIAQLRRDRDNLTDKIKDTKNALRTIKSNISDTEGLLENNLARIEESLKLKLHDNAEKLRINIAGVKEALMKEITEKSAHIAMVEQQKSLLCEIIKSSTEQESKNLETSEAISLPNYWDDNTLVDRKKEIIEKLQNNSLQGLDGALDTINQTKNFFNTHLMRSKTAPSFAIEVVFPFWYIEIQSGDESNSRFETYTISPSDVSLSQLDEKSQMLLGTHFIPRLPSVASMLDSLRNQPTMRSQALANNTIDKLNIAEIFPSNHWIVRRGFIQRDFYELIMKDYKKGHRN